MEKNTYRNRIYRNTHEGKAMRTLAPTHDTRLAWQACTVEAMRIAAEADEEIESLRAQCDRLEDALRAAGLHQNFIDRIRSGASS